MSMMILNIVIGLHIKHSERLSCLKPQFSGINCEKLSKIYLGNSYHVPQQRQQNLVTREALKVGC